MEFKLKIKQEEGYVSDLKIPRLSSGFNSYYIDKLKHLKESLESVKGLDKNSRYYKVVSPCSVNKETKLYKY